MDRLRDLIDLVISSLDEPGKRSRQHAAAVRAVAAAGVQHVAYTSIVNPVNSKILISQDHADTEAELAKAGVPFTVLRNNMYSEYQFAPLQRALASGKLIDAKASGKVGFVTRDDCARIAAGFRQHFGGKRAWQGDPAIQCRLATGP